jgi:hypothetical protein
VTGQHYEDDDAAQEIVRSRLRGAGTNFYGSGVFKLVQRWQQCVDRSGDFV